jgi:outer membrane protein assembly factor BamB
VNGNWLLQGDEVFAPPLVQPEGIYVITYPGQVIGLNRQGAISWQRTLRGAGIHPVQQVSGDLLAATKDGTIRRFTRDGSTQWEISLGERLYGRPIVTSRQILALDAKGRLRLLDPETGAQQAQMLILEGSYAAPGFNTDGWVLVSQNGVVVRLDNSLQEVWRYDLNSSVVASPCLAGPWAVIGDRTGQLHVFRFSDGRKEASLDTGSEWIAPPIADGNALFGVTHDGTVHCYIGQE